MNISNNDNTTQVSSTVNQMSREWGKINVVQSESYQSNNIINCDQSNNFKLSRYQMPLFAHNDLTDEQLAKVLMEDGRLNITGLRIPLKTNWNMELFESLCTSVADKQVALCLKYGWLLNRDNSPLSRTWVNHPSANRHPQEVLRYLCKELRLRTIFGPYLTSPFPQSFTGISPLSTRPKKHSMKRRIIVDLSWPPDQPSVNSGIPKDTFMETAYKIRYPTIDTLCKRAILIGPRAVGWRKDMERAFLQLPLDPIFYSALGIIFSGGIFFNKMAVMGCRSAPWRANRQLLLSDILLTICHM